MSEHDELEQHKNEIQINMPQSVDSNSIDTVIKKDKKQAIKDMINHKNCQKKILYYMNLCDYSLIISSGMLTFISASTSGQLNFTLSMVAGCASLLLMTNKNIRKKIKASVNDIIHQINDQKNNLNSAEYKL